MKKLLFTVSLLLTYAFTFAQIETIKSKKIADVPTKIKYDSLKNYMGDKVYAYIGQELYLRPKNEMLREYGYEGFYIGTDDDFKNNDKNVYKCCEKFNAIYDSLQGKYFKVLAVSRHPKAEENPGLYGNKFFLKLAVKGSSDTCYYEYDSESIEETFPFTVVGYYMKAKKRYIGRKFTTQGKRWTTDDAPEKDIETAKPVSIVPGKVWTVVDVSIDDKYFELSLILKSQQGEKVAIAVTSALKSCYFVCPAQ